MHNRYLGILILFVIIVFAGAGQNATAAVLDLTDPNASGFLNGAFFSRTAQQGSGTGNLDPFVRIQAAGTEEGYNTDGQVEFDTKQDPHTHSLLLSSVPIVNVNGIDYREFILDTAEPGEGNNSITLTALKFYLLSSGDVSGYPANFPSSALKYNLDGLGDSSISLDNLTSGNGSTDMFAYIPTSSFSGSDQYVYLYSKFSGAQGSFEEWAVIGPTAVPEPATMSLLGLGLAGLLRFRRKLGHR